MGEEPCLRSSFGGIPRLNNALMAGVRINEIPPHNHPIESNCRRCEKPSICGKGSGPVSTFEWPILRKFSGTTTHT